MLKNIILSTVYSKVINIAGWESNWENNVLSASFVIPLFVDSRGESDELLVVENKERVDGPISLEVKYLERAGPLPPRFVKKKKI